MRLTLSWPRGRSTPAPDDEARHAIRLCELWRLDDAAADAYGVWRQCCAALETAYARWIAAGVPDRPAAFAACGAALDREQRAAARYAASVARCVHARRRLHAARHEGRWP